MKYGYIKNILKIKSKIKITFVSTLFVTLLRNYKNYRLYKSIVPVGS